MSAEGLCPYLNSMDGHGSPTAADLQDVVSALDVCPLDESIQLVQLRLLQGVACRACRPFSLLPSRVKQGIADLMHRKRRFQGMCCTWSVDP